MVVCLCSTSRSSDVDDGGLIMDKIKELVGHISSVHDHMAMSPPDSV